MTFWVVLQILFDLYVAIAFCYILITRSKYRQLKSESNLLKHVHLMSEKIDLLKTELQQIDKDTRSTIEKAKEQNNEMRSLLTNLQKHTETHSTVVQNQTHDSVTVSDQNVTVNKPTTASMTDTEVYTGARNLLNKGHSKAQVAAALGLSIDEVNIIASLSRKRPVAVRPERELMTLN